MRLYSCMLLPAWRGLVSNKLLSDEELQGRHGRWAVCGKPEG